MNVAITLRRFGFCLMTMELHKEALKYLNWSLQIILSLTKDAETDQTLSNTLYDI